MPPAHPRSGNPPYPSASAPASSPPSSSPSSSFPAADPPAPRLPHAHAHAHAHPAAAAAVATARDRHPRLHQSPSTSAHPQHPPPTWFFPSSSTSSTSSPPSTSLPHSASTTTSTTAAAAAASASASASTPTSISSSTLASSSSASAHSRSNSAQAQPHPPPQPMIGPPPSFYDPDTAAPQPPAPDYAQWLAEHYSPSTAHHQYPAFAHAAPQSGPYDPHQQHLHLHQQQQQQQQLHQQHQQPLMNQYQFVASHPHPGKDDADPGAYAAYFAPASAPASASASTAAAADTGLPTRFVHHPQSHQQSHQQQQHHQQQIQHARQAHHQHQHQQQHQQQHHQHQQQQQHHQQQQQQQQHQQRSRGAEALQEYDGAGDQQLYYLLNGGYGPAPASASAGGGGSGPSGSGSNAGATPQQHQQHQHQQQQRQQQGAYTPHSDAGTLTTQPSTTSVASAASAASVASVASASVSPVWGAMALGGSPGVGLGISSGVGVGVGLGGVGGGTLTVPSMGPSGSGSGSSVASTAVGAMGAASAIGAEAAFRPGVGKRGSGGAGGGAAGAGAGASGASGAGAAGTSGGAGAGASGAGAGGGGGTGAGAGRPRGAGAGAGAGRVPPRKRLRVDVRDSETEDEDEGMGGGGQMQVQVQVQGMGGMGGMSGMGGMQGMGMGMGLPQRLPGACTYCKKLKMKCDFPKNENVCKRCRAGGHTCIVEGRKPRSAPNKREYLLAQIRQKDAIIESLLKQLHNPYLATPLSIAAYRMATPASDNHRQNVIAWLDRLQSSSTVRDSTIGAGLAAGLSSTPSAGAYRLREHRDADDDSDIAEGAGGAHDEEQPKSASTLVDPEAFPEAHAERERDAGAGAGADPDAEEDEAETYAGLPDAAVPLGLLAKLSISNSMEKVRERERGKGRGGAVGGGAGNRAGGAAGGKGVMKEEDEDDDVGVANDGYFLPGPAQNLELRATLIEKNSPPDILVHGLITPEDVDKLFDIFYTRVNPFISLLDPVLHTPASTFSRCPFLFTVVCAISSRYSDKSEVYPIAMHFAKSAAANSLIDGWKSVELCQAYILMSIYAVPARRWEEDRSWLYTGLAIRIATDLNLHQLSTAKPQNEIQEREMLNRARVWQICFNLDRSTATQFGKPTTIKEDYIVRNSTDWYKKSRYNHPYDVHLDAYCSLMRIVAKFHDDVFSDPDTPTGLNQSIDFREVTLRHDGHLERYHEEWAGRFARDSDQSDPACAFRCKLLPFLVNYSRLVMYSFGFQQAFQRGMCPEDEIFLTKSRDAAKEVIRALVDSLAPSGYMRFSPDGHFIFAAFASAFLLKLNRPEFAKFLPEGQDTEVFELIGRLIQTIGSPQIAIDERHTPKLYSRFLAGLLAKHRRDGATSGRLHTQPPPGYRSNPSGPHRTPSTHSSGMSPASQDHGSAQGGHGMGGAGASGGAGGGASHGPNVAMMDTFVAPLSEPIYQPEAMYSLGMGPLEVGGTDDGMNFVFDSTGTNMQDDVLATMQAIRNPAWWNTMMMPGFSWPETNGYMSFPQTAQVHLG